MYDLNDFEFKICNVDGWNKEATQECLDQIILKDQTGKSKFYPNLSFKYYFKLVLPTGLKCNHCVFQVKFYFLLNFLYSILIEILI